MAGRSAERATPGPGAAEGARTPAAPQGTSAADAIEQALVDLMAEQSFASITVKQLCSRAHVSRVSYYRSFSSKEDVLRRHIARRVGRFLPEDARPVPDEQMRVYLQHMLVEIQRDAGFFTQLRREGLMYLLYEFFFKEGAEYIRRFQPSAVPYQGTYYTGGTLLVIFEWIDRGMPETPDELAGIIDTLYYRRNF